MICGFYLLASCRADVDLKNIDTTAELELGMALPIGSMSVTLGDILGTGTIENLDYRADGTFYLHADYYKQEHFHRLNFENYISNAEKVIPMYDIMSRQMGNRVPGRTQQFTVDADILLQYEGINNNLSYERIDSAYINRALVQGYLKQQNMPVPFEWIDKIILVFGPEFTLNGAQDYTLYTKGSVANADYGTLFPVDLQQFVLDLVKDHAKLPGNDNVLNSSTMRVSIDLSVPENADSPTLSTDMAFIFGMNVQFIDYKAVWGMFEASNRMYDEDEMIMDSVFPGWSQFRECRLPLAEPTITMHVVHRLAGPVFFNGDYLYVRSEEGQKQYAEFGGKTSMRYPEDMSDPDKWMSVDLATIEDSVVFDLVFDKDPARGHIDKLFTVQPDYLAWKWNIDFDLTNTYPQARITPNTDVEMDIDMDIPFVFNEGLYLTYTDTVMDINLTAADLDSLASGYIDSITAGDVYLNLQIENTLPVDLRLVLRCLDADGNILMDETTGEPLRLSHADTIMVKAPDYTKNAEGKFIVTEPGKTGDMISLGKDKYANVEAIKSLVYQVILDDRSLKPEFNTYAPDFKVRITNADKLKIRLGIGAKVGVQTDLSNLGQQQ